MDMEQEELQFIDIFGIYKESCKLIFKLRKILTKITLSLILPLSFIFLAQERVSEIPWLTRVSRPGSPRHDNLSDLVSTEWAEYVLLKLVYFAFVLVFSLLSTSAVVYTVACVYTARDATFKNVMSVLPRVWKRLIVTFLCAYLAFFLYNLGFVLTLYVWGSTIPDSTIGDLVSVLVFIVILILYAVIFVYLTMVWQLASVVSVLEDSYGIKAMLKSKSLLRGKMMVAAAISFMTITVIMFLNYFFMLFVVYGVFGRGLVQSLGFGVLCLFVLMMIILFALVVQTVVYLVCKAYHHENIDKSELSDHLERYLGDYEPLMAKNVQMEDF